MKKDLVDYITLFIKKITREQGRIYYRIKKINEVSRGWINYFRIGSMKSKLQNIDEHLRTMVRVVIWKQWKVPSKREWGLQKLGIGKDLARLTANCGDRYFRITRKALLSILTNSRVDTVAFLYVMG